MLLLFCCKTRLGYMYISLTIDATCDISALFSNQSVNQWVLNIASHTRLRIIIDNYCLSMSSLVKPDRNDRWWNTTPHYFLINIQVRYSIERQAAEFVSKWALGVVSLLSLIDKGLIHFTITSNKLRYKDIKFNVFKIIVMLVKENPQNMKYIIYILSICVN